MDKKYDEALERAKKQIEACGDNEGRKRMIYAIFPELVDNKDEDIRKDIIEYLKLVGKGDGDYAQPMINRWIAYLEKNEEPKWSPSEGEMGALYKLCYISNQITDEDDTELTRLYQDLKREYFNGHSFENMFSNEKQKEQKPLFKQISDSVIWDSGLRTGIELGKKEQKSNIELIQCSWYMEGYYDRKFGKEPKWIIKTGEGGPKYEENPKYGQMLEAEQKPLEWSEDFEDNIRNLLHDKLTWHSEDGSMSTTVFIDDKTLKDIVSGIWFYVGKEALKYPNKELNVSKWSEEDNAAHTRILGAVAKAFMGVLPTKPSEEDVNWLKTLPERFSLQPKQEWSKEDDALLKEIVSFFKDGTVKLQHDLDLYAGFLENKFKSLRPQPRQETNIDKLRKISTKADEDWLEIQKQWEKEDKYKSWMTDYFRQETIDGHDWKTSIIEYKKEGKLSSLWNSMLMGRLGMYVRNWMREQHPEIDEDFPDYADFEDYSWKIFQDLVNEWEIIPTERNVEDVAAEYIEGVKSLHKEPDWNLMHTAVIYGYQLGTEKCKTK